MLPNKSRKIFYLFFINVVKKGSFETILSLKLLTRDLPPFDLNTSNVLLLKLFPHSTSYRTQWSTPKIIE